MPERIGRGGAAFPRAIVTDDCEVPSECWELVLSPLLLTAPPGNFTDFTTVWETSHKKLHESLDGQQIKYG